MRSIKRRLVKISKKYPNHGVYMNFAKAVRGQKFGRMSIQKAFNKLVDSKEYEKKDKKLLIHNLELLSNTSEDSIKMGVFCL